MQKVPINTEQVEAYLSLAVECCAENDYDRAVLALNRALEIDPANSVALSNRGAVRYMRGEVDGATEDLDRAIRLDPGCGRAFYNRGVLHGHRGQWDEAFDDFTQALERNPCDVDALLNRAAIRVLKRDLLGAASDLERAMRLGLEPLAHFLQAHGPFPVLQWLQRQFPPLQRQASLGGGAGLAAGWEAGSDDWDDEEHPAARLAANSTVMKRFIPIPSLW